MANVVPRDALFPFDQLILTKKKTWDVYQNENPQHRKQSLILTLFKASFTYCAMCLFLSKMLFLYSIKAIKMSALGVGLLRPIVPFFAMEDCKMGFTFPSLLSPCRCRSRDLQSLAQNECLWGCSIGCLGEISITQMLRESPRILVIFFLQLYNHKSGALSYPREVEQGESLQHHTVSKSHFCSKN